MLRIIALFVVGALGSGCYAFALPPSRTDFGTTAIDPGTGRVTGVKLTTGVHTASARYDRPARTDVGAGYVYEGTRPAPQPMPVSARPEGPRDDEALDDAHGAYLELSRAVQMSRHHRTWLGLRSEALWHDSGQRSLGVSSRLSWELFGASNGSGSRSTRCGFVAGTWTGTSAFGAFVETGARAREGAPTELVATAGLTVRLPLLFAMGMDLCSILK